MGRNLLTALSLLLALGLTDGAFRQFDCTRPGSECRNGGTCDALTGECTCNNIYQGYDCGLGTSLIRPTCTITCQNGGTCYVNPFNEECYCTPDFWGTTCEKPRQVMEACGPGPNGIVISIKPTGTFSGVIYISGEYGNPGCQFQYDAPNDDYRITLTDGDCPAGNTRETNVPTLGVVSSYTVIVQYNPAMVNSRDGRHVFSCVPNSLSTILTLPSIETG
ncbi:gigasin-2-like [Liolophura sinensis]|uniref:gigasin-2-like n=1 Tax=Liolophura sinensis TaxID=3198878 RepID=UPI003158AD67